MIVTGANSGCGFETAKQLVQQGVTVILACRNIQKGEETAQELYGKGNGTAIFLTPLDLASLESVKTFVHEFLSKYQRLDALINNAGIMACPPGKTKDGFELQLGSNHLSHFYLMRLLTPILLETAKMTGKPSRFIALSSVAAAPSIMSKKGKSPFIDFDDLMWEKKPYDEVNAYCQSKLANYLHAYGGWEQISEGRINFHGSPSRLGPIQFRCPRFQ